MCASSTAPIASNREHADDRCTANTSIIYVITTGTKCVGAVGGRRRLKYEFSKMNEVIPAKGSDIERLAGRRDVHRDDRHLSELKRKPHDVLLSLYRRTWRAIGISAEKCATANGRGSPTSARARDPSTCGCDVRALRGSRSERGRTRRTPLRTLHVHSCQLSCFITNASRNLRCRAFQTTHK